MPGSAFASLRRPIALLAVWVLLTAALCVAGVGVGGALSPSIVVAPGTPSAHAQQLAEERFGPTQLVPILLEGPASQLRSQGSALTRKLAARPHTRVLSPWNAPAGTEGLVPRAGAAMVLVSVDVPEKQAVEVDQPAIEALVARTISEPVRASITGQPSIDAALAGHALSTARTYGLIAFGVLCLLLFLGLRPPGAAALVALLAAASAASALGAMRLLGGSIAIDPVAVPLGVMAGLALGAAYSLIALIRRPEGVPAGDGASPGDGAPAGERHPVGPTVRAARGPVLLAGGGMVLAMALASAIAPTTILVSVGIGIVAAAAFATLAAVVALPAALALLAGMPAATLRVLPALGGGGALMRRHALLVGPLGAAALVLLALPALGLEITQPGISQLPKGDRARASFERVAAVMGPGWPTPYDVLLVTSNGPITTAPMLADMSSLEGRIARQQAVASVSGPGSLSAQTKPLGKLPGALKESGKLLTGGKKDLQRLLGGLGEAGSGARQLQGGLESASAGATELHNGSATAQAGAGELHSGLRAARGGSETLQAGLGKALEGAGQLKDGATQALAGAVDLVDGTGSVRAAVAAGLPSVKQLQALSAQTSTAIASAQQQAQGASGALGSAVAALEAMSTGKSDPRYTEALTALRDASGAVGSLGAGLDAAAPAAREAAATAAALATRMSFLDAALGQLQSGARQLQAGLAQLRQGNAQLAGGLGKLAGGGEQLTAGLRRLAAGAGELEAGLGLLAGGSGELQEGLAGGVAPVGELVAGLGLLQSGVAQFAGQLPSPKDLEELQRSSPDLFSSGYFVLAAVEGAPPQAGNAASFTINLQGGGNAGQIAVISKHPSEAPATLHLGESIGARAQGFARAHHLSSALGGPAASLSDLTDAVRSSIPWVIAGVALATALLIVVALRAILISLAATVLALLMSAAAFGLLSLILGGPARLDPIAVVGILTVAFGTVLLFVAAPLVAIRRGADAQRGVPVAAAAGVAMLGVLIPFAIANLASVRQLALGVAVAVALAALLVRPLMLPAMVDLLGAPGWWPGARNYGGGDGSATGGDGQSAPMEGGDGRSSLGLVHRVLRRRGHYKEVHR